MRMKKRVVQKLLITAMAVAMVTGSGAVITANATGNSYPNGNYTVVEQDEKEDFKYEIIRYDGSYNEEAVVTDYTGTAENVVIPEQINGAAVTTIGNGRTAFTQNTHIKSIVIPKTVKSVDATAFVMCQGIREITVPESVTEIHFFEGLPEYQIQKLNEQLTVYGKSGSYAEEYVKGLKLNFEPLTEDSDFTYEVNGRIRSPYGEVETITITGYQKESIKVEIPPMIDGKQVTEIGENVFAYSEKLKSVTIPESVRIIRERAFHNCWALEQVTIPESVTKIENQAFYQCYGVTIRGKAESTAKEYARNERLNFEEYGEDTANFEEIFEFELNGSDMIYNPETGTAEYTNYIKITKYKGSSKEVVIPSKIGRSIVNEIGDSAFYSDTFENGIRSVSIPYTVQKIGNRAFYGTSLVSADIPQGVIEIGASAFERCPFLRRAEIADTVTEIGSQAFGGCERLTDLKLSEHITEIKDSTFANCRSLENIVIPSGVQAIGGYAFSSNSNLKDITFPDSIKTIGAYAFSDCTALEEVSLPKVKTLENSVFRNTGIKNIVIPDSVTEISADVFSGSALESITIPKTVQKIDFSALSYCKNLSKAQIAGDNPYFMLSNGVIYNKNQTELLYYIDKASVSYTVPKGVVKIGSYAFCDSNLNTVNLHSGITEIGEYAFAHSPIKNMTVPNGITVLKKGVFRNCEQLESINIPHSVTEIGEDSFWYCSKLTEINLPSKLKTIGDSAFYHSGLKSVDIPDSVTDLEVRSFGYCMNLQRVSLSKNIKTIKRDTFEDCRKLVSITIPSGVTEIGSYAFAYCSQLNEIFIPESVTKIDSYTFRNSDNVTIYSKSGSYAQTYANNKGINFVPLESLKIVSSVSKSTVTKGESITVKASGTGGTGSGYTYAFYYKKSGDTSWKTLQGFKENSSKTFKPTATGTYSICAKVQDTFGTITKKYFTVKVFDPLVNGSTIGKTSIKTGETVTLNGFGTGGTEYYQYAFYSKPTTSNKWTELQSYGTKSAYNLKPDKGTYDICIKVKDSNGTVAKKYFKLTVSEPLVNNASVSATSIKSGGTIKVTAKATGGTGTYTYASYYKLTSDKKWTENQSYSSNSSITIKPTLKGTYDLCIKVKDSNGTIVKKYFTFTVQ